MGNSAKAKSIGRFVLQLALGCMLVIGGIWALQGAGDFGADGIRKIFNGNVEKILVVVYGVIELLTGIFLIIELFTKDIFGKFDQILGLIIMITWIVAIVLGDIINGNFNHFLPWLYGFASHIIILGALWSLND